MAVATINQSLAGLAEINKELLATKDASGEMAALLDAQARLIDQISPLIEIETRRQSNGALQVFSTGGEFLVDRGAAVLEFETTPIITPQMRYPETNHLSGITIHGREMSFEGTFPKLGGGELETLFKIRDKLGTDSHDQLDAMARNLIERFELSSFDTTRAPLLGSGNPADAGLFTNAGQPVVEAIANPLVPTDPPVEWGLASRIAVNDAVRADATNGDVRRLRDGLAFDYTTPPAPVIGNPEYLSAQLDLLSSPRQINSGKFATSSRSMAGLISDHTSLFTQARQLADQAEVNRTAVHSALRGEELSRGVDTDAEMQNLLRIENIYAANARVVQAADAMLEELIRMT
jgi:flagellar hook-associated protein 1 FlgK